jgi:hypothetical protein
MILEVLLYSQVRSSSVQQDNGSISTSTISEIIYYTKLSTLHNDNFVDFGLSISNFDDHIYYLDTPKLFQL